MLEKATAFTHAISPVSFPLPRLLSPSAADRIASASERASVLYPSALVTISSSIVQSHRGDSIRTSHAARRCGLRTLCALRQRRKKARDVKVSSSRFRERAMGNFRDFRKVAVHAPRDKRSAIDGRTKRFDYFSKRKEERTRQTEREREALRRRSAVASSVYLPRSDSSN